jgi:hypothetical protein
MEKKQGFDILHGDNPALLYDPDPPAHLLDLTQGVRGKKYGRPSCVFLFEDFEKLGLHQRVQAAG